MLRELGLDIHQYVKDCQNTPKSPYDLSDLGLPDIYQPVVIRDRGVVRQELKKAEKRVFNLGLQLKGSQDDGFRKKLNSRLGRVAKKVLKLKAELLEDDKHSVRVSCTIKKKGIRFQFRHPRIISKTINKRRQKTATAANNTHTKDSNILMVTISYHKDLNLHAGLLHDSLAVPV